jgi:hypothetical protein
MDLKSLIAKMDQIEASTYISEATAPTEFIPTHFHKGNLGNKMPLMQTPDGTFWWEGGNQGGEGPMTGSRITLWNGDTLNRSGWNPASVDGVIKDGKYIDFPEGVSWKDYKQKADDESAVLAKLKKLLELVDKYMALKAKRGQGARPATPTTQDMGDGSKLTVDPKTGVAAATNDDGTPYVPGSNPNLPKNRVGENITFKGSIANSLVESFGYKNKTDEGVMGVLGKAAPGVGAVLGAQGAYDSYKKGDYLGAALNGLSGAFSLVPGLGWIPALGFGAWQAGRELSGATDKYDTPQPGAPGAPQQGGANPTPGNADPKLQALQKKLIAAGADLGPTGADGVMGKYTQAAMQKFPNIKEGVMMTQPKSVAEAIRELQQRLELIENDMPLDPSAEVTPTPPAEAGMGVSEGPATPPPATTEQLKLADELKQVGGKEMVLGDRTFMVFPEKGICVELPSMEICDGSTPALTPTGKKFDPAALGLGESLDEGIWDSIMKGAVNVGRNFSGGLKGAPTIGVAKTAAQKEAEIAARTAAGIKSPKSISDVKKITGLEKGANTAGKVVGNNPIKTGLAATAAGLGAGYLGGSSGQNPSAPVNPNTPPNRPPNQQGGTNPSPDAQTGDDEEMKALRAQIEALMKDLSTSKNPEVQKGLADIQAKLK